MGFIREGFWSLITVSICVFTLVLVLFEWDALNTPCLEKIGKKICEEENSFIYESIRDRVVFCTENIRKDEREYLKFTKEEIASCPKVKRGFF